jgi:hypothetical protein
MRAAWGEEDSAVGEKAFKSLCVTEIVILPGRREVNRARTASLPLRQWRHASVDPIYHSLLELSRRLWAAAS